MALMAFSAPILPGKTEAYEEWAAELTGDRRGEYEEHMRRVGKTREWSFLQRSPQADFVVVVHESDDLEAMMQKFVDSEEPFDVWFKDKIEEIHGIDLAAPPPMPERKVEVGI